MEAAPSVPARPAAVREFRWPAQLRCASHRARFNVQHIPSIQHDVLAWFAPHKRMLCRLDIDRGRCSATKSLWRYIISTLSPPALFAAQLTVITDSNEKQVILAHKFDSKFSVKLRQIFKDVNCKYAQDILNKIGTSRTKLRHSASYLYRLIAPWPEWVLEYAEKAAHVNDLHAVVVMDASVQPNTLPRLAQETLQHYYRDVPARRGYQRSTIGSDNLPCWIWRQG